MFQKRIAMWSGPRNISTAMMRAWGNRPDTFVCDEPFYSHYLLKTGIVHPGAEEVIRHHERDWRKVVDWLTVTPAEDVAPAAARKTIFYQKQMTHHLLPEIDRAWLTQVDNAFLIREPREVITSFIRIAGTPRLEDTGYPQQLEIFEHVFRETGRVPPVIDARDVLENPPRMLRLLCEALDVEFTDAMLSWPPGLRDTDGIWAKHWYDAVVKTTTFQPYKPKDEPVPDHLQGLLEETEAIYRRLHECRLTP